MPVLLTLVKRLPSLPADRRNGRRPYRCGRQGCQCLGRGRIYTCGACRPRELADEEVDDLAVTGVFDGVAEEVGENLSEGIGVDADVGRRDVEERAQADALLGGVGDIGGDHARDIILEIGAYGVDLHISRLDLAEIHQLVDRPGGGCLRFAR